MIIASTMSVLMVLMILLIGYVFKLNKQIKNRDSETKTMQKCLKNLEESVNKLIYEIVNSRGGMRPQASMVITPKFVANSTKESSTSYSSGYHCVPSESRELVPLRRSTMMYN